jgi:hypothetical protein
MDGLAEAPVGPGIFVKLTDPIEQAPPAGTVNTNPSPNEPKRVANAGAVLLWPYLPCFFDQIGLVEEGEFLNADARGRGVMLIHYLVTGSTEAAAYSA